MFQKGQKIVCINAEFPPAAKKLFTKLPTKDSVYTVRSVYVGRGNYTAAESGQKDGEIGVLLEEIVNPPDPCLRKGLTLELGFNSERFTPLETDEDVLEQEKEEVYV